jgi:hypothetical protein
LYIDTSSLDEDPVDLKGERSSCWDGHVGHDAHPFHVHPPEWSFVLLSPDSGPDLLTDRGGFVLSGKESAELLEERIHR